MKLKILLLIAALVCAAAGGYWLAGQQGAKNAHYGNAAPQPTRKILYYRNPMGLPDTSPTAKKDAMGMDYIPVYEGEDVAAAGGVKISSEKVQKLGVKTDTAALRVLEKTLRLAGRVEADERHVYDISPRFEGWIEKLYVNATFEPVKKGQALFDLYSPELVSTQREYAIAAQGVASMQDADPDAKRNMQQLADSSLLRLKNWGISAQQLQNLASTAATRRDLTFYSPVNGIVLEKKALQGMRFMPGDNLYRIADLSTVWVLADVAEEDIAHVRVGNRARVKINAYPDKTFDAIVSYVYPSLNPQTRTVPVRLELPNPQGLLKPAMYAQVEMAVGGKSALLTVPASAVIDSGTRSIVLIQLAEGRFEPREVTIGSRGDDYVQVLNGVSAGEQVVVAANFLIDSESNLKAALSTMGAPQKKSEPVVAAPSKTVGHQGRGIFNALNADGTVNITFETIKSLGMQGMTMDFPLANPSLASAIKPGTAIDFELIERGADDWLITRLQARQAAAHEGH